MSRDDVDLTARLGALADPLALLRGLFEHSPVPYAIFGGDGRCAVVNAAYIAMFGRAPPPTYDLFEDEVAAASGLTELFHRAFTGETVATPTFWYDPAQLRHVVVKDAKRVAIRCTLFPLNDRGGVTMNVAIAYQDLTAELTAREDAEARQRDAEAAQHRSEFLAAASAALSESVDVADALRKVAALAVPGIADWCSITMLGDDGRFRRLVVLHRDPARAGLAQRYAEAFPPEQHRDEEMKRVLHGNAPVFLPNLDDATLIRIAQDDEHLRILRGLGVASTILVPITVDGAGLGVVSLVRSDAGRPFTSADVGLAADLAARAAVALRVVRLFADLRASEGRTKAITDNATVGLFLMDAQRQCVFMNPAAERITGYTFAEVAGRTLHDLVHHTRPDGAPFPIEECTIEQALPANVETHGQDWFVRPDGTFYPVVYAASPIHDGHGKNVGTVVEVRDTTSEKNAQSERDRLLHDLQEAVRVRDDFLSVAGHELKTPLAAVLMHVEGLQRRLPDGAEGERMAGRLQKAEVAGRRLASLIDQLLDVSRITAGRVRLDREELDLVAVVKDVVARQADAAAAAHAAVRVSGDDAVIGSWDPLRLEQVVANLLGNAIKYGRDAPIEVTVKRAGDDAVLIVRDHGIGIAPEQQARIFERFERAVASREYGGFGLGLWIAREIVQASGGTITVDSAPGAGATFTVKLPRAPPERAPRQGA